MGCAAGRQRLEGSSGLEPGQNTGQSLDEQEFEDGSISIEEAVAYVQLELDLQEDRALQLVLTVDCDGDNRVSSVELVYLSDKIKEIKFRLEPKFRAQDPEKTGFVDPDSAIQILGREFPGINTGYIRSMLDRFDTDQNCKVDFYEFIQFFASIKAKKTELEEKFKSLDVDGSGDLDPDELCTTLMQECALHEVQARSLVEDFDVDKDGRIGLEEFMGMWTRLFG